MAGRRALTVVGATHSRLTAPPAPTRRRIAVAVTLGVAGAVGAALLLGRIVGYGTLLHSLHRAQPGWLALCVPVEVAAYAGYIAAFKSAARLGGGPELGWRRSARVIFASLGATRLVIGGGPGVLYWALRRSGATRAVALRRLLALNALLFGVLGLAAWLAALTALLGSPGAGLKAIALPWLLAASAVAGAGALLLTGLGLGGRLARVRFAAQAIAHDRRASAAGIGGVVLFWLGDLGCLWAGLRAFGVHVGPTALVLAYATSYAVTMLPAALGGAGGAEAAIALALRAVGVPLAAGLLGVLAYRLFSFWLPTLPGLAALATAPRLGRELERR